MVDSKNANHGNKFKMSLMAFTLVTLAALMSIRNFPTMALVKMGINCFCDFGCYNVLDSSNFNIIRIGYWLA